MNGLMEKLENCIPKSCILMQEPMSKHTTFRIGGPADLFLEPENAEQLLGARKILQEAGIPCFLLGNGSNLLVSDEGYRGAILKVGPNMSTIRVEGNRLIAGAGALMSQVAKAAWEHGLTGLEFASGIPGTIGGGITMNAGAYGGELCQVAYRVQVVTPQGEIRELTNEAMKFGYRHSIVKEQQLIVTEVELELQPGNGDEIKSLMDELATRRREKQPLEYPSAGSTFKRPEGYFAGELIMKADLRGFQIGGARVSDKHCGFVVNVGRATGADVRALIAEVQSRVWERFQVKLEPEVIFLGFS
ncbi:MAG: UDP-N-acetylmuramate dehydrogenase [Lachnospiraceae bacterium]|nr:UDP-N-acetylmuramate dehydrogenase [Lachnospiraceae bacterium]